MLSFLYDCHFGKHFIVFKNVSFTFLGVFVFVLENFCFCLIFVVGKFCKFGKVDYLCKGFVLESFTSTPIDFLDNNKTLEIHSGTENLHV